MIWSRFFHFLVLGVCAFVLVAALVFGAFRQALVMEARSLKVEYLYIESGNSLSHIASMARKLGLVERSWHFSAAARLLGQETRLQAGEYEITPAMTLQEMVRRIAAGDVFYRKIAVPEGMSVAQVEATLWDAPGLNKEGYLSPVEGSLLPETYYYTKGETAAAVVLRMQENMKRELDVLWDGRAKGLPIKSKQEAVILASIVEKETGMADERPLVAAVFINRLKRGMRLQSDPTVVYGIKYGEALGRRLTSADLREETPYNTYRIAGLPPTPIANPGLSAIAAVLSPANVDYLYFVADGTGGHAFARSLKEHNQNVRRWRHFRASQNSN